MVSSVLVCWDGAGVLPLAQCVRMHAVGGGNSNYLVISVADPTATLCISTAWQSVITIHSLVSSVITS
jgi:hypothetical protein